MQACPFSGAHVVKLFFFHDSPSLSVCVCVCVVGDGECRAERDEEGSD